MRASIQTALHCIHFGSRNSNFCVWAVSTMTRFKLLFFNVIATPIGWFISLSGLYRAAAIIKTKSWFDFWPIGNQLNSLFYTAHWQQPMNAYNMYTAGHLDLLLTDSECRWAKTGRRPGTIEVVEVSVRDCRVFDVTFWKENIEKPDDLWKII